MNAPLAAGQASAWRARLELGFAPRGQRTRLVGNRHTGPLLVQRAFNPEAGGVCHAYLIHPPAGVVGGDQLELEANVASGAAALITTPSATRFYRSSGATARLEQRLRVAPGASLEWLPQENLLFEGARARIATRIELEGDARFCAWELLCLGRPACGEGFERGEVEQRLEVTRDGRPLLRERLRTPASGALRVDGALLRGFAASATLLASGAGQAVLDTVRTLLGALAAPVVASATLLQDLLVCRLLAPHVAPLRAACERLWAELRPTLLERAAHAPRIWAT